MSKSVLPEILEKLESYLDRIDATWLAQAEHKRLPTLPCEGDRVNVRGIVRELNFKLTWEQHFYNKPEIMSVVNRVCEVQGLKGIKSRSVELVEHDVVRKKIRTLNSSNNDLSSILAEREELIEALRAEIQSLREQLGLVERTGMYLRDEEIG